MTETDSTIPPPRYTIWQAVAVALRLSSRALEEVRAATGKARLPAVTAWAPGVHYLGAVVTTAGGTWQAVCDTAAEPPHDDWLCLAERGADGRTPAFRGAWKPASTYEALDVVMCDGSSFIALYDAPGACPGDGWRLLASRGKSGPPGSRGPIGERGYPGPPGASPVALDIDGEGIQTLRLSDGSTITCDLYPVLSRLR